MVRGAVGWDPRASYDESNGFGKNGREVESRMGFMKGDT